MPSSSCPEPPASLLTCRSGAGLRAVPQGSQDGDLWLHLRPARGQPAVVVSSAQHATAACRLMRQHAWLGQHCRHGCSTHCKAGQAQQAFKLSPCLTVCATSLLYSQAACCAAHRLNCGHPPGDGLARQGGSSMSGCIQHRLPALHRAASCWLLQLAHLTPVSVAMGSSGCICTSCCLRLLARSQPRPAIACPATGRHRILCARAPRVERQSANMRWAVWVGQGRCGWTKEVQLL